MTAMVGAEVANIPSMHAEDNPRLPIRCRQRTRGSVRAMSRTSVAVPSGESSSTKMTSHPEAPRVASRRHSNSRTLRDSLKVGTTIDRRSNDKLIMSIFYLSEVLLTEEAYGPIMLICCQAQGYKDPLYLITNLPSGGVSFVCQTISHWESLNVNDGMEWFRLWDRWVP